MNKYFVPHTVNVQVRNKKTGEVVETRQVTVEILPSFYETLAQWQRENPDLRHEIAYKIAIKDHAMKLIDCPQDCYLTA